jgi:tripartite-type tricarboxylate transporter receptor subunit TctC
LIGTKTLALATALGAALAPASAAAQSPADFYKGKTVTITLGQPPGGSYDSYARLVADHLRRFIPGNPNLIVQHRPGGGGVSAVRWFYAQAPRDGTALGLFSESIGHTQMLAPELGQWKVEEMSYVGSLAPSNGAMVVRKGAPATTPEAMRVTPITVGCSGVNSPSYQYPAALKALGGLKFNLVCGYPGSAEVVLAMQRGEVDIYSASWHGWRVQPGVKDGSLIPVIQGGLTRLRELANVPLTQELVADARAKRALEFISAGSAIGRALIAAPGVPDDHIAALRDAFDRMVKDGVFLADAAKRSLDIEPSSGAIVQRYSEGIAKTPRDIVESAASAMAAEKR